MAGERAFTEGLARFFPAPPGRRARVPLGDDAAVVQNRGSESVLCCDPVVEGVHFDADAPPGRVGHKAVQRNLSDLAAMGAAPDWLLVSLLLPEGYPAQRRRRLLAGIRRSAAEAGCHVVGGDVSATPGPLVVMVTAVGHLVAKRPLCRDGARPGDLVHVTGALGGAALGRHLRFRAPLAEGAWLARHSPPVSACIDVSDGLALDLDRVLAASGRLGAVLDERAVPVSAAARRLSEQSGREPLQHALTDGEDHVLLFTVRPDRPLPRSGPLGEIARQPIGLVDARQGLWLKRRDGTEQRLRPEGHQHGL